MEDRKKKNIRRILTGAAAGAAAVMVPIPGAFTVAAGAVGVNTMFEALFERGGLAESKPFAVGTEFESPADEGQRWCDSMPQQPVQITAQDGISLAAHYLPCPNEKRTVILCHGWHGHWDRDLSQQAKWLYENGSSLLLIEQRAHGSSGGEYLTFGLLERHDLRCWIDWINDIYHPQSLYLLGQSMGGTTVLMAGGDPDLPPNVRGIIDDCGFTSPYEQILNAARNRLAEVPEHPVMDLLDKEARVRMGVGLKDYSAVDAMRVTKTPVVFIHGMADKTVAYDRTMENYVACKAPKKLVLVENAAHCMCWYLDKEQYTQALTEFFAENDIKI